MARARNHELLPARSAASRLPRSCARAVCAIAYIRPPNSLLFFSSEPRTALLYLGLSPAGVTAVTAELAGRDSNNTGLKYGFAACCQSLYSRLFYVNALKARRSNFFLAALEERVTHRFEEDLL